MIASYESERLAKTIFAKWIVAATSRAQSAPTDRDTEAFAQAAVWIADGFLQTEERYTSDLQVRPQPIVQPVTFEELVLEWQRRVLRNWSKRNKQNSLNGFRRYLFPYMASRLAHEIQPPELAKLFLRIQDAGHLALAHRILRETFRAYRFGIASGYATTNPAADIQPCLVRWKARRRTTILVPRRIGELLRAIDRYKSNTTWKYYLRLLPLLFVRPGELRHAEWNEVDFASAEWRIPARRMKGRRPHIVPLSKQALQIFRQVHARTPRGRYVFPSDCSKDGVIATLGTTMLRRIGFGGQITLSGFRSMAATVLSEQGWSADAIEGQLSHADPRPMRRVYSFAQYMPERRRMMQAWANYLDKLAGRSTQPTNV